MTDIVHIVDDDAAFRDSLALMLKLKKFRTAEFTSAEDFLAKVAPGVRGCLLADVQMPGMSGIELHAEMVRRGISLPTIIITAYGDVATARAALKGGAVDILEKPLDEEALERIVSTALAQNAEAINLAVAMADITARMARLTSREREVLDLVIDGRHNREIAVMLGISPRTVEVFKARMMEKMRVTRVPDLIRLVMTLGSDGASS